MEPKYKLKHWTVGFSEWTHFWPHHGVDTPEEISPASFSSHPIPVWMTSRVPPGLLASPSSVAFSYRNIRGHTKPNWVDVYFPTGLKNSCSRLFPMGNPGSSLVSFSVFLSSSREQFLQQGGCSSAILAIKEGVGWVAPRQPSGFFVPRETYTHTHTCTSPGPKLGLGPPPSLAVCMGITSATRKHACWFRKWMRVTQETWFKSLGSEGVHFGAEDGRSR